MNSTTSRRLRRIDAAGGCILWLACAGPAAADGLWSASLGVEQFLWKEFDDNDNELLDESGPRLNLGLSWLGSLPEPWTARYRLNLYLGTVDYDGAYQDGTPLATDTDYVGLLNELTLRYDYSTSAVRWGGFGALGLDAWERAIANPTLGADQIERYRTLYLRGGIMLGDDKTAGDWYAELGVKYPVFIWETAELQNLGYLEDARLKPAPDLSLTGELSYRFDAHWSVLAGYDSFRFRASDAVAVLAADGSYDGILQPRSTMDLMYLRASYTFD